MDDKPLYLRLGGREGIHALMQDVVGNHFANPALCTRYEHASKSRDELAKGAAEFFCTGLSGIPTYEGASLAEVHAGMNVSEAEFVAAIDDILDAMAKHGIGEAERAEALGILWGMKGDVVHR